MVSGLKLVSNFTLQANVIDNRKNIKKTSGLKSKLHFDIDCGTGRPTQEAGQHRMCAKQKK